jgi:hypothetical protein
MLRTAGWVLLLGWSAIYIAVILLAAISRRSWTDLLVVGAFLIAVATLLALLHPIVGGAFLTGFPIVIVLLNLNRGGSKQE